MNLALTSLGASLLTIGVFFSNSYALEAVSPMTDEEKLAFAIVGSKCWNVTVDKDRSSIPIVTLMVKFNHDASIKNIRVQDKKRYKNDSAFRKAADNEVKTLKNCDFRAVLPPEKFEEWQDMELTLDPKTKALPYQQPKKKEKRA